MSCEEMMENMMSNSLERYEMVIRSKDFTDYKHGQSQDRGWIQLPVPINRVKGFQVVSFQAENEFFNITTGSTLRLKYYSIDTVGPTTTINLTPGSYKIYRIGLLDCSVAYQQYVVEKKYQDSLFHYLGAVIYANKPNYITLAPDCTLSIGYSTARDYFTMTLTGVSTPTGLSLLEFQATSFQTDVLGLGSVAAQNLNVAFAGADYPINLIEYIPFEIFIASSELGTNYLRGPKLPFNSFLACIPVGDSAYGDTIDYQPQLKKWDVVKYSGDRIINRFYLQFTDEEGRQLSHMGDWSLRLRLFTSDTRT